MGGEGLASTERSGLTIVKMFYSVNGNNASLFSRLISLAITIVPKRHTTKSTLIPSTPPLHSTRLSTLAVLKKYYVFFFGNLSFYQNNEFNKNNNEIKVRSHRLN